MRTNKIRNETDEIKNKNRKKKLSETIRSFNDNIYCGKIALNVAGRDQDNLLKMVEFKNKSRPRWKEDKKRKISYNL